MVRMAQGDSGAGEKFRVIAPDLRVLVTRRAHRTLRFGDHRQRRVGTGKRQAGLPAIFPAGHDWGGPVAFSLAPTSRRRAPPRDNRLSVPATARPTRKAVSVAPWLHQTRDMPERLIEVASRFIWDGSINITAPARRNFPLCGEEYVRVYSQPGALRSASSITGTFPLTSHRTKRCFQEDGKWPCPCWPRRRGWLGRGMEVVESCQRVAIDVRGGIVEGAGHWIPEEHPPSWCGCY